MSDYKYFTHEEMACTHCKKNEMDDAFMAKLDFLREVYNKPMIVSSGYRCPEHPIEARKESAGAHSTGKAVDIAVSREEAYMLLKLAMQAGFMGVGLQQKGSGRFLHLDMCNNTDRYPRPTVWSY